MNSERGISPAVGSLLMEIVTYHRDRDDFPIFFIPRYIVGHTESSWPLASFRSAIDQLSVDIKSLPDTFDDLNGARQIVSDMSWLPPGVIDQLGILKEHVRLAHGVAYREVTRLFGDISHTLTNEVPSDSRVLGVYPELRDQLTDRDHLVPMGSGTSLGHSWVDYRDHQLHLHPGLRRGFGAGVNYELVKLLQRQAAHGLRLSVGIDHFRLCPKRELPMRMEKDYWFGPPLDLSTLDDPNAIGATVHTRTRDFSFADKAGLMTEFRWTFRDGIKSFEAEEIPLPTDDRTRPVLCRFVHSMRDCSTSRFVHLDGALTVYSRADFDRRRASATDHKYAKVWAGQKPKLFRIDAAQSQKIDERDWVEIVELFFKGNELVLEYLSGRSFDEIYREQYGQDYPYPAEKAVATGDE